MNLSGEQYMPSPESYFRVYFWSYEAIIQINAKLTLTRARKHFFA